ncbi:MAG: hypothetical protein ABI671_01055 [Burkholderiales bacterium]
MFAADAGTIAPTKHTEHSIQTIGFIGTSGLMSHGMAKNLRCCTHLAESLNLPSPVEAQEQLTGARLVAR